MSISNKMLCNVNVMDSSTAFSQGKSFSSVEEVKACIKQYNERNFTNFVISCNGSRTVSHRILAHRTLAP